MSTTQSRRTAVLDRPTVLVLASPYVLATALASSVLRRGMCDVVVPHLDEAELTLPGPWDAVLTVIGGLAHTSGIVMELPNSFEDPVVVTVDGKETRVIVAGPHPIDEVMALLEHHLERHLGRRR